MSGLEKNKWRHDDDFDSDSNISMKLSKVEDDDKMSSLLHLPTSDRFNISFSQKRSNPERERHAELFRKDLISAMKLADSEVLQPEEYFQILDPWKLEWERGVQVPINPGGILPSNVRLIEENENLFGPPAFKLPKKYLHTGQDDSFKPAVHELHEVQKLTEQVCRYDLDDLDTSWLQNFNELREEMGEEPVIELNTERVIEELETHCHAKLQQAQRTIQGLGIEYDENVVCDVCRSPEGEDSNEMVFCDSCDICVHQACYGIQMIPEGNWLCRVCALGIKPQCVLCPNSGGAMKSTKSGSDWAHISCALWIPEVSIGCPEKMEPINNITQIPASRWALVCTLCRERQGACIQCSVKSCKTSFHVTCAFQNNLEMNQTYDETLGDVQMKAFCPKHSGQRNDDSVNEDMALTSSPKPPDKPKLTEEERTELRSHRLKKLEEEFCNYVTPKEVAQALEVDEDVVCFIYNYWAIKRKSQFNRPLLMPKLEEGDLLLKQREDGLVARLNMFIHLRQELERVRNLCYMVNKREKLSRQMNRMKEDIFFLLAKAVAEDPCQEDLEIMNSYRMTNTIYDHPDGILRAARLMEQMELTAESQESSSALLDKDGEKMEDEHDNVSDVKLSTGPSANLSIDGGRKEFHGLEESIVKREVQMDLSDLEPCSQPISVDAFEVKSEVSHAGDDKVTEKWITDSFKVTNGNDFPKTEKPSEENRLPLLEFLERCDTEAAETAAADFDRLQIDGRCLSIEDDSDAKEHSQSEDFIPQLQSVLDIDWLDDGDDDDDRHNTAYSTSFQDETFTFAEEIIRKDSAMESKADDVTEVQRSPCLVLNHSETQENYVAESPLPSFEPEELAVSKLKRMRPSDGVRHSKRSRRANENLNQLRAEKKEASAHLPSDSSTLAERCGSTNSAKSLQEISQVSQDESVLKLSSTAVNSNDHHHSPALDSLSKPCELKNGWSGIRQKFSFSSKLNGSEILKRFSPEQLVVPKEIRERVERCLLNLPSLKTFNGLCRHLHQKLASCNLHYSNSTSVSSKTLDADVKEPPWQTSPTSLCVLSSNSASRKVISNGCSEPKGHSTPEHQSKFKFSSPRLKDEVRNESEKSGDCQLGGGGQQKTCNNYSADLGSMNPVSHVYDDPIVYELSSESSQSSIAEQLSSDDEMSETIRNSLDDVKLNWFSKVRR